MNITVIPSGHYANNNTFGGHMVDFTFLPSDFNSTEITVVANTKDAKEYLAERYGFGCLSLTVRKSAAIELADSFEFQNLSYS